MHAHARHTHTHHDDTTVPERGDCMLVDEVVGSDQLWSGPRISNCRKPALERLARHSLFDRYMKAQLRLAGGRRKPGRHGFSSDTPRECLALPYICATCATLKEWLQSGLTRGVKTGTGLNSTRPNGSFLHHRGPQSRSSHGGRRCGGRITDGRTGRCTTASSVGCSCGSQAKRQPIP